VPVTTSDPSGDSAASEGNGSLTDTTVVLATS
jgi:hypothetical protein